MTCWTWMKWRCRGHPQLEMRRPHQAGRSAGWRLPRLWGSAAGLTLSTGLPCSHKAEQLLSGAAARRSHHRSNMPCKQNICRFVILMNDWTSTSAALKSAAVPGVGCGAGFLRRGVLSRQCCPLAGQQLGVALPPEQGCHRSGIPGQASPYCLECCRCLGSRHAQVPGEAGFHVLQPLGITAHLRKAHARQAAIEKGQH